MNFIDIMNSECIHCNVYFLNRSSLVDRKKRLCGNKILNLYPVNNKCTNPYCNTITDIKKKIKDKNGEDKIYSEQVSKMEIEEEFTGYETDLEFTEDEPGTNYDNWDIEPNTKVFRKNKKTHDSEIQKLFKNLKISKNMKKKKKMTQLKITEFDISNLINKLSL
jgi:hypothetical protein